MVIFEHVFDDTTGIRIVTLPNEDIGREEVVLQMRVQTGPSTIKMVKCALTDPKTHEDLYPLLEEALLKNKMKEIGKQCEHCCEFFLPKSPNQKFCPDCKDLGNSKEDK
jgi:hypothetical protein